MTSPATPSVGEVPPDATARHLVASGGLDRTLFVEAGAGTGKTTQLVERVASLVLTQGVEVGAIAAITFTEAAAAELAARIRVRFEQEAHRTDDRARRERCHRAIADLDLAAITTLHGFAHRLLGEFGIVAGLPPRVAVVDEVTAELEFERRWERFVDRLHADVDLVDLVLRCTALGIELEPAYTGQPTMKEVAAEFSANWDRLAPLVEQAPPPLAPLDFGPFQRAVGAVADIRGECDDPDDKLARWIDGFLPAAGRLVGDDPHASLADLADALRSRFTGYKKVGLAGSWPCGKDQVASRIAEAEQAAEAVVTGATDEVLRWLAHLLARELVDAAEARRREGLLQFHDLLVLARDLLRSSARARRRLHDRYRHLLLDEFQDTDPIQIELAALIAATVVAEPGDEQAELTAGWAELSIEEGRLFFVGDPKQSIYRFRRADIGLYLDARDRFGDEVEPVRLTTNFRTVAPVIAWVNQLFHQVMGTGDDRAQPAYEALQAWRSPSETSDHRPLLVGGPHPDVEVRAGELRRLEAADVARVLAEVRDRPDAWPVHDSDGWRPARLADVTILVPTRTSLPWLRAALDDAGVAYRLATGTLVYATQEVVDLLAALAAIDDPGDTISLVTALRSPLYACSDVELAEWRRAGGRWRLDATPPADLGDGHPVAVALAHLHALRRDRWWTSPASLLARLIEDRRAHLLAFGDPRPTEVWRRLRFLLDQARRFEESGGGGLRAFLAWAELQGSDSARVHEPLLPETDGDAVSIMTIHGAKGLEFPITVLAGMTTEYARRQPGPAVLWGDDGVPQIKLRSDRATLAYAPRADLELAMDRHERIRLLYVAATRARDHLVVSCHHRAARVDATYAGRVWQAMADHADLWRADEPAAWSGPGPSAAGARSVDAGIPEQAGASVDGVDGVDDRDGWIARRSEVLASAHGPRFVSATSVVGLARAGDVDPAGPPVVDEDDDGSEVLDEQAVPIRRRGRAGTAIGRAVHAVLQTLDLGRADSLERDHDLRPRARAACDVEAIPHLVDEVVDLAWSAVRSEAVALCAGRRHHAELYVAAPVGERVIEGYVDLLVVTDEGLVVVDYKTDGVRTEADVDEAVARYELQGAAYALALATVTGRPVVECRFVFCRPGRAIERTVADLPAAMARVRSVVGGS